MWAALIKKNGGPYLHAASLSSGYSLYADTTYDSLTQAMIATAGLAALSPEQQHGQGCHRNPGAGQVPEEEEDGDGTSCCTEPRVGGSSSGCLCPLPPGGEGCASKMRGPPYSTCPHLPVGLQCLKQAWIFLFTQRQRTSQKQLCRFCFPFLIHIRSQTAWCG